LFTARYELNICLYN